MSNSEILFDVAITTYRRPAFVAAAIRSCLSQGSLLRKVIVVDDASGDETRDVIASFADSRIDYYERAENGGTGMARHDALKRSRAPWVILLDSDWELMPRALELFADLARTAPDDTVILGSRIQWDHGGATPSKIPLTPLSYEGQVAWRSDIDGLWLDNLCAISQKALQDVEWPPLRIAWHAITLFYLDIGARGVAVYSPHCLAYEKTDAPYSDSRGSRTSILARRKADAPSGVVACEWLLERHGPALRANGRPLLASILRSSAVYAYLSGHRGIALKWLCKSMGIGRVTVKHVILAFVFVVPRSLFEAVFCRLGACRFGRRLSATHRIRSVTAKVNVK